MNILMVNNMVGISKEEMIKRRIMPALRDGSELCSADIVMILKDSGMHWVPNSWQLTNVLKRLNLKCRKINKLKYWRI